jgi:hypothetical protein
MNLEPEESIPNRVYVVKERGTVIAIACQMDDEAEAMAMNN